MASTELQLLDDSGLSARQVQALERLIELGAEPAPVGPDGKVQWSHDPKIRAFQMIYEGRFGGPQEGAGRPKQQKRATAVIAEALREEPRVKNMIKAIDRALKKDAGSITNLQAVKLAKEIEQGERKLQIEEEEHEGNSGSTREELIATLFQLVQDPATERAIEGSAEEITEAEVIEGSNANDERADTASSAQNGTDGKNARTNGRGKISRDRPTDKNPLRKAALRRAANG